MMETPDSSHEDRLSNLPPSIVDFILVLLPIRDAVRTSILSHQWRYRWTSIPQLVFNEECIPRPPIRRSLIRCSQIRCPPRNRWFYSQASYEYNCLNLLQRVTIVDHVLSCHKGPIHKFQCTQYLPSCSDIHRWITFLSSHPIKEFILQCFKGDHYKVPSNLFSYQYLQYLLLTNCIVQPPRTYSGFADLTTLKLFSIIISSVALESLLSTCKSLEELRLIDFQGLTHLKVVGPNLKRIYISGSFQGLHLDAPHLTSAEIDLFNKIWDEQEPMREGHGCNLAEALHCVPRIERLVAENNFLKFLALGTVPPRLQPTYKHLEDVYLCTDFSSINQMSAACCLIASAPNLQNLRIYACLGKQLDIEEFAWQAHDCQLNCLRSMVMVGITGIESELSLLGFVLANAPLLRTMTIQFAKNRIVQESKIFKKLIRFRRASPQATIEYLEDDLENLRLKFRTRCWLDL